VIVTVIPRKLEGMARHVPVPQSGASWAKATKAQSSGSGKLPDAGQWSNSERRFALEIAAQQR
jgi:hypothetical protein